MSVQVACASECRQHVQGTAGDGRQTAREWRSMWGSGRRKGAAQGARAPAAPTCWVGAQSSSSEPNALRRIADARKPDTRGSGPFGRGRL